MNSIWLWEKCGIVVYKLWYEAVNPSVPILIVWLHCMHIAQININTTSYMTPYGQKQDERKKNQIYVCKYESCKWFNELLQNAERFHQSIGKQKENEKRKEN